MRSRTEWARARAYLAPLAASSSEPRDRRVPVHADRAIAWAAKDVFNPAAAVHGGRVCLVFRAEDRDGPFAGTSRLGLATSIDG